MTSPFDPTPDNLTRIDRDRAAAWLREHGWEACPWMMPEAAGLWWRLRRGQEFGGEHFAEMMPPEGHHAWHSWRGLIGAVARAHGLHGLALWAVVVAWQAPCSTCAYASDGEPSARSACQRCPSPDYPMYAPDLSVGKVVS